MYATREFGWGRLALYGFCVAIPSIALGISNYKIFLDAFWMATLMLLVTAGVAAIFTYYAGQAVPQVRNYCTLADLVVCIFLCVNLGCHWAVTREISGAKESLVERHAEEDRAEERKNSEVDRQAKLMAEERELTKTQSELARQESLRLRNEAIRNDSARRLGFRIPQRLNPFRTAPTPAPTVGPATEPTQNQAQSAAPGQQAAEQKVTPEDIRKAWNTPLMILAFIECFVSILAGAILSVVWEWDRNRNGIPDRQEGGVSGFSRGAQFQPIPGHIYATDANGRIVDVTNDPNQGQAQSPPVDFQQRHPSQDRPWWRRIFSR